MPLVLTAALVVMQLPHVFQHSADPNINQLDATWRRFWLLTFAPLYAIVLCLLLLPGSVELGETALVLHRPLRRRRVLHWRNIQCILVDERGSRRRVAVFDDDPDGRRTVLPVPFTHWLSKDSRFDEKFQLLGQTWLIRRGDDWEQLPAPYPSRRMAEDARPNTPQP